MTAFVLQMHSSKAVVPLCVIEAADLDSALEALGAMQLGERITAPPIVSFKSKEAEDRMLERVRKTHGYAHDVTGEDAHYTLTEVPLFYDVRRPQNAKIDPFSAGC